MSIQELSTEQAVEMITCVIDGFEVTVPKGTLVIRAAVKLGIQIPRFCDHPLLAPAGACRQCLVDIEINGRAFPKPQASCTIPVENGMVVKTQLTSLVADKAQKGIMELLLINPRTLAFGAVLIGIILAAAIQMLTGFFTEVGKRPVNDVAASSKTGPATVILAGVSVGFESAVYSAILIAAAVYGAFLLGGGTIVLSLFAVALAGCGLLTTVGVIVAMDTFGPISDNAQGIAEMSGDVKGEGAKILTSLDAVGNTTKAITKDIVS